jgi:hypothetical protein
MLPLMLLYPSGDLTILVVNILLDRACSDRSANPKYLVDFGRSLSPTVNQ